MSAEPLFSSALLVEDEPHLSTALRIALRKLGITCHSAQNLTEANAILANGETPPEFILLDRALPDGDGLSLCKELRTKNYGGVIMILTAAGQISDRIDGLNTGADDYLPKPFSWAELEARIRALYRRQSRTFLTKSWELDPKRLSVFGPQGWVELTPLEFKLASKLILSQGTIVTRDELLKNVWGFNLLPKTRTVDHFLGRLRKHFEKNPEAPEHFITVRGAGYRFQA